jgi:hypothetical protein
MGRSYYVLQGMRVPTQAKGNALALDVEVLAGGADDDALFQLRVALRQRSGWCYLKCHRFGVFGTTQLTGGYVGEDGKNWKAYEADHDGSVTEHTQAETVVVPMTLSELRAIASGDEFGFQLCIDRVTFTPKQKARLVKYVDVVREATGRAQGAVPPAGEDEVGIPESDQ